MRSIRFLASAMADIRRKKAWYREITPELAVRFQMAIETATQRIVDDPEAMQVIGAQVRRWPLDGFPHGVLYRVEDDSIVVLAVFHPKQAPGTWRRRAARNPE